MALKLSATFLLAFVSLGAAALVGLITSGHWPYGRSGYVLNDVARYYTLAHITFLILAAPTYLALRRLSWPSVGIFAAASLLAAAGHLVLYRLILQDIKGALQQI